MNSRGSSIRAPGQRSIVSTFLFRASNQSGDCNKKVEIKAAQKNGPRLSFSDFLNRRLHRSSVLPTSVLGKKVENLKGGAVGGSDKNRQQGEPNASLDGVFQMLKNFDKSENSTNFHASHEIENIHMEDFQQMRKRKNLHEEERKPNKRKVLAVLGEDLKPLRSVKRYSFAREEDSQTVFNHYANGSGWWDENMAGVDNEEVGSNEAWEGVGSTTLGGMEWH